MPGSAAKAQNAPALVMRLSVPAEGGLRAVAAELASRIAEHLGIRTADAESAGASVDGLADRVARGGSDITFEFREIGRELVIEARCNGQSSEVRHRLPS